jgi:hypothetical protein
VLLRGHLLITAFLQAEFRKTAVARGAFPVPPAILGFALLAGIVVALPFAVEPRWLVRAYLGPTHLHAYSFAFLAALVMPLLYVVTAARLYLQYQGRDWSVTLATCAGLVAQGVLLALVPLQGTWLVLPLFIGGIVYLLVIYAVGRGGARMSAPGATHAVNGGDTVPVKALLGAAEAGHPERNLPQQTRGS